MARFNINDADKYGGQGGGGYFRLQNDGDVAKVRILLDSADDIEGVSVHEVEVDGKKRYVNCLREYGQPMDVCPMCAAKMFTTAKYFIPLYNIDEDRVQTWERGKKFGAKIASLCARYPHLVSHTFEIERNGKAGDTQTTYEIYETGQDNTSMDNFDVQPVLGSIVLDKTADEMEFYLNNGYFDDGNSEPPVRRRQSTSTERRTPVREAF